jgi:putative DNA primase/helicase
LENVGVLNWLLEGCIQWDKIGLQIPDLCEAATAHFRQESDDLADFIAEYFEKDSDGYCLKSEVYESYKRWSDTNGIKPMTKRALTSAFQERGFESGRTSTATRDRSWTGWRLKQ